MRFDTFVDKKSIHFKLDKDVHLALRAKLFKYNISMQELFDEFANLVVTDVPKARSIVESILSKKMKSVLSGEKKRKKKKREVFNEVDTDTLYNMINESED
jgi:hypothetical protein